ncbi:MAG: ATP-grasp fold amidoligase family protein [Actinomycetes bacterium]
MPIENDDRAGAQDLPKAPESSEMSRAASLLRRITPRRLLVATRPLRARIKESNLSAGLWTLRKKVRFAIVKPRTFNQKMHFKMAWDRRPILTTMADKDAVRAYITGLGRPETLNEVFAVVDDPRLIDLDALPSKCVIKPTHGSGAVIVIHDRADASHRIPVNFPPHQWFKTVLFIRRENIDREAFNALCDHWLGRNYWRSQGSTQWAYLDIPPRLIVEEYLEVHKYPIDYRFMVINQKVAWIQVNSYNGVTKYGNAYLRDGTQIPFDWAKDGSFEFVLPPEIAEMVLLSEELAQETDFVRVDLYLVAGKIYFSELTNYPSGGRGKHYDTDAAAELAKIWVPKKPYR